MTYTPPASSQLHFDFTTPLIILAFNFTSSGYSPPAPTTLHFDFTLPLIILDFEFFPEVPEPISKQLLLSLGLRFRGQVYKYWICQMSHGVQQVRRYVVTSNPRTPNQQAGRAKFAAGMLAWQNLSDSDKLLWHRVGVRKRKPISSHNAFLSAWMRDKI